MSSAVAFRPIRGARSKLAAGIAIAASMLAAAQQASAQTPPPDFDGTNATYFITANSMLRYGDSLFSKRYMTVGSDGMQIKGRGPCTQAVCPVTFNGIDLFARRSRLRLEGGAAGNDSNSGYGVVGQRYQPGKQCAGITRTLRPGDESNEVRTLQEILIKAGFKEINPDGRYGRKTEAAVVQMQRRANINPDGRVGPKTIAILPC